MVSVRWRAALLMLSGAMLLALTSVALGAPGQKGGKKAPGKAPAANALIAEGAKVYASNGCSGCHTIGNKGGKMGPNLTHVGKSLNAQKLVAVIRTPKKVNPKGHMPAYDAKRIKEPQLKALVAYLLSLK